MKTQKDSKKQYAKVVLIISCVFAVISSVLLVIAICGFPQALKYPQLVKYLYENGIEVDAYAIGYYDDYSTTVHTDPNHRPHIHRSGRFHIVYEYVDDNGDTYTDEYSDTVVCRSRDELRVREQYIKQIVADEPTKKMLIADNGMCCLSVNKESLKRNTALIVYSILIPVSSVVLGLCIFGIVRQSKKLRQLR